MNVLQGKVAIVTGSSGGIGAAIAETLAKEGAKIVIDYHSHPENAEKVKQKIISLGSSALTVQADVSSPADIQKLVEQAVKTFG